MALTTKPDIKVSTINTTRAVAKTIAITPSSTNYLADVADKPIVTRGIWCAGAGNLKVEFAQDPAGTYRTFAVEAGVIYPFAVVLVHADTTATGIIGLL